MNTFKTKADIRYYKSGIKEICIKNLEGLIICNIYFDEVSIRYRKDYDRYYIHVFTYYNRVRCLRDMTASIMVNSYEIVDL